MAHSEKNYTKTAIALHWLIAIAILCMLPIGIWMADAIHVPETRATAFTAYQLHKSVGLTILALVILRLFWRLTHPPPPLPEDMPTWERLAANSSHAVLYILMIAMPLIGWAMVSSSPIGLPTIVFGTFEWPHMPWLSELEPDDKKTAEGWLKLIHRIGGYTLIALVVLHVAAAVKHHMVDKDDIMARMLGPIDEKPTDRA